jgi:mRNA interferase MazF
MTDEWVPDAGDIVFVDFNPQVGHEQGGKRPAVVLTPKAANRVLGLCTVLPVTSQGKNYPFEVRLPQPGNVKGVVLCDQIKSMDWRVRNLEKAGVIPQETLQAIRAIVKTLLGL